MKPEDIHLVKALISDLDPYLQDELGAKQAYTMLSSRAKDLGLSGTASALSGMSRDEGGHHESLFKMINTLNSAIESNPTIKSRSIIGRLKKIFKVNDYVVIGKVGVRGDKIPPNEVDAILNSFKGSAVPGGVSTIYDKGTIFDPGDRLLKLTPREISVHELLPVVEKVLSKSFGDKFSARIVLINS